MLSFFSNLFFKERYYLKGFRVKICPWSWTPTLEDITENSEDGMNLFFKAILSMWVTKFTNLIG